ncbi:hypothetical protein J6590_081484 [Homalodisca vitripennis]|nr:hypothetical protein J6590_081484 [Homalodisca vitripennis]
MVRYAVKPTMCYGCGDSHSHSFIINFTVGRSSDPGKKPGLAVKFEIPHNRGVAWCPQPVTDGSDPARVRSSD